MVKNEIFEALLSTDFFATQAQCQTSKLYVYLQKPIIADQLPLILATIMRLFRIIRLIWTFYKNFLPLSIIITAFCLRAFWIYGFSAFFGIFWGKIVTLGLTYYLINSNKKNEYYYYQNLGLAKTLLWAATLVFDFVFFLLLIFLAYQFK